MPILQTGKQRKGTQMTRGQLGFLPLQLCGPSDRVLCLPAKVTETLFFLRLPGAEESVCSPVPPPSCQRWFLHLEGVRRITGLGVVFSHLSKQAWVPHRRARSGIGDRGASHQGLGDSANSRRSKGSLQDGRSEGRRYHGS